MAKISPVSIKYSIKARIELTGMVERPDVIGAVFGQTEGLLGSELELRELQKAGRIGRIDVSLTTKKGKSEGEIIIPSSMSKSETAIVAAAMETIDRVGPAEAKIRILGIKDIRETKRDFIIKRAQELLENLMHSVPDSTELTSEVVENLRTQDIENYEGLPAGPDIEDSEELIIVEGRADVINLLKHNVKNVIGLNGARAPPKAIIDLARQKKTTLFVDGDRGGDLILKNLSSLTDIKYVAKAPDGKEVEELNQKEILKALRSKEEWKEAVQGSKSSSRSRNGSSERSSRGRSERPDRSSRDRTPRGRSDRSERVERAPRPARISPNDKDVLKGMGEDLMGSRGAFILDNSLNVLGRVPIKELADTLDNISENVYAVVMDGSVDSDLDDMAKKKRVRYIIAKTKPSKDTKVQVMTAKDL